MNVESSKMEQIHNMVFGIVGETGEVVDILKKHIYQGHDLYKEDLSEEIGDVMFYVVNLCNLLDLDLETIIEGNYNKLLLRYPEGFDKQKSINRGQKK